MGGLIGLFNFIPAKREISAVLAFLLVIIQGWNSLVPELGHGPCLATPEQIADALKAVSTCASDWTLKIPDTINNLVLALLGVGVVAGKANDNAEIMAQVKPAAQTVAFKKEESK
jgi:hypothetical protein